MFEEIMQMLADEDTFVVVLIGSSFPGARFLCRF